MDLNLVVGSSLLGATGKVSFTVDSSSINPVGTTELTEYRY